MLTAAAMSMFLTLSTVSVSTLPVKQRVVDVQYAMSQFHTWLKSQSRAEPTRREVEEAKLLGKEMHGWGCELTDHASRDFQKLGEDIQQSAEDFLLALFNGNLTLLTRSTGELAVRLEKMLSFYRE